MVAKSYQNLPTVGEPFISKGKYYIQVLAKSGPKIVRWYSEKEYLRMYPNEKVQEQRNKTPKEVLGFDKGYITIFKGNTYENVDYFRLSNARYAKFWGWYIVSTEEIPKDLPEDVEPVSLDWELVGNEDGTLKTDAEIAAGVDSILYDPSPSEYQGEVGERLELWLTVDKAISLTGYYGESTMHVMHDDADNCYVWTTAAKSWEVGSEHHIKGTIKEHKLYKGIKQNILTRCTEIN